MKTVLFELDSVILPLLTHPYRMILERNVMPSKLIFDNFAVLCAVVAGETKFLGYSEFS